MLTKLKMTRVHGVRGRIWFQAAAQAGKQIGYAIPDRIISRIVCQIMWSIQDQKRELL